WRCGGGLERCTVTRRQVAPWARTSGLPSLAPLSAGRPRRPVREGARSNRAALAGSLVVHVVPATSSGLPWYAASPTPCTWRSGNAAATRLSSSPAISTELAVPLPAHNRNNTGRHSGAVHNGRRTTIPATAHRLPRAIFLPP